jgi:hypothetical protein
MSTLQDDRGLSLRELVLEVRADVKGLDEKIEKIDRNGSIGTREELTDHETRIRGLEKARWGLAGISTIVGSIGGVLAAFFIR